MKLKDVSIQNVSRALKKHLDSSVNSINLEVPKYEDPYLMKYQKQLREIKVDLKKEY